MVSADDGWDAIYWNDFGDELIENAGIVAGRTAIAVGGGSNIV